MIFLSLMFIVLYLSFLIKGGNSIFNKLVIEFEEYNIKKAIDRHSITRDEETEMTVKVIFITIIGIGLSVLQIIFFIKALKIDIYLYPTIGMIVLCLFNSVFTKKTNKYDLTTEEGRYEKRKSIDKLKHRTFKGILFQSLYLGYFIYIFYILVFLI